MTTEVPGAGTEPLWGRLRLVCASANPDKVAEIATILGDAVELLPRPSHVPDVVEDADTLVGNARLKAVALVDATGMPAIADDTGLEVDALGGAPGVFTARFAGVGATYADNRQKLLLELAGVPEPERGARFVTVAIVVWPDGRELAVEGSCTGTISADGARRARIRLRRGVRPGRRRRPHVRRDVGRREARALAPWPGVPRARRRARRAPLAPPAMRPTSTRMASWATMGA